MEVPRLGIELEQQLQAYATATPDPSSRRCRILNPLREARNRTRILMDASQVRYLLSHDGNSMSFWIFNNAPRYPDTADLGTPHYVGRLNLAVEVSS